MARPCKLAHPQSDDSPASGCPAPRRCPETAHRPRAATAASPATALECEAACDFRSVRPRLKVLVLHLEGHEARLIARRGLQQLISNVLRRPNVAVTDIEVVEDRPALLDFITRPAQNEVGVFLMGRDRDLGAPRDKVLDERPHGV